MDRITIRLDDASSAELSRCASRSGVSRARWIRELVLQRLAAEAAGTRIDELERRMEVIEGRLAEATGRMPRAGS